jgi:hypothetical protein
MKKPKDACCRNCGCACDGSNPRLRKKLRRARRETRALLVAVEKLTAVLEAVVDYLLEEKEARP